MKFYESCKISNYFLQKDCKYNLFELRIMYIIMSMLQNNDYDSSEYGYIISMSANDIRKFIGTKSTSIYRKLEDFVFNVKSGVYINNLFFSYISDININKLNLTIILDNNIKNLILSENSNYTIIDRKYIMNLSSSYSFRMYELLKKDCYYRKFYSGTKNGEFTIYYGINEYKDMIGVSKNSSYNKFSNFKSRCLDKSIEEINKNTDIKVSYELEKDGRGSKVQAIIFNVYFSKMDTTNRTENTEKNSTIISNETLLKESTELLNEFNLNKNDIISICKAANFNVEKIRESVFMIKKSRSKIYNITGWIIKSIKNGYTMTGYDRLLYSNENMERRNYNFDDLELMLLETNDI